MSTKFCFDLNKRLSNLVIEENAAKALNKPIYHPFKYCLRYKHVPSLLEARKLKDELESERSTNVSLKTEDSRHAEINQVCGDQTQKIENSKDKHNSSSIQPERYILEANKKNSSIPLKIKNVSSKPLSQNKSNTSATKASSKFSRTSPALSEKSKLHASNVLSQKSNVQNRQPKQAIWRTSTNSMVKNSGVYKKKQQTAHFGYDLSVDELKYMSPMKNAMKPPLKKELSLLQSGQRLEYLSQRYLRGPECKYNYPEATSWRIGWLHKQKNEKI